MDEEGDVVIFFVHFLYHSMGGRFCQGYRLYLLKKAGGMEQKQTTCARRIGSDVTGKVF